MPRSNTPSGLHDVQQNKYLHALKAPPFHDAVETFKKCCLAILALAAAHKGCRTYDARGCRIKAGLFFLGHPGGVMNIKLTTTATLLSLGMLAGAACAENGVTSTEITLGMCNVLTGPAAALGLGIQKGSSVYFDKINKSGGV